MVKSFSHDILGKNYILSACYKFLEALQAHQLAVHVDAAMQVKEAEAKEISLIGSRNQIIKRIQHRLIEIVFNEIAPRLPVEKFVMPPRVSVYDGSHGKVFISADVSGFIGLGNDARNLRIIGQYLSAEGKLRESDVMSFVVGVDPQFNGLAVYFELERALFLIIIVDDFEDCGVLISVLRNY